MTEIGQYDKSLHMFVELPKPVDRRRLGFLRWLGERGKLEHWPVGPSSGPLTDVEDEAAVEAAA